MHRWLIADEIVHKVVYVVIARHIEKIPDFWWLIAIRPQLLFDYRFVRQLAVCSGLKYAIANNFQPFPICLGCVIGKDEGGHIYEWPNDVLCISVIAANEIRADNDGRVARYI